MTTGHPFAHAKAAGPPSPEPGRSAGHRPLLWDIFCRVIDNFGDVGVCWRLAADLAGRGHRVRLWLDDSQALTWMAPDAAQGHWPGISVHQWPSEGPANPALALADVWIEAFGCQVPDRWLQTQVEASNAQTRRPVWINLEYLSAEPFALRCHGLPSPVLQGPAAGWTKYFFYPGLSPVSGGLLAPAAPRAAAPSWAGSTLARFAPLATGERSVLLFSYASAPLNALFDALLRSAQPVQVLVAAGQTSDAVRRALPTLASAAIGPATGENDASLQPAWHCGPLRLRFLPYLPQPAFDLLLALCDLNLVRGEDSLAQAVQAGKPCIWQIYPQDDGAHVAKLQAYLDAIDADTPLRAWHGFWNSGPAAAQAPPTLPWPWDLNCAWAQNASGLGERLACHTDVASQLLDWAQRGTPPRSPPPG